MTAAAKGGHKGGHMDARIRARRARVRADAVRRRQRRTLSLFVLLLVVAGIAVALRSPLFGISAIQVTGVTGRRAEVVERTAALEPGQHLLTAPLDDARARVEALPWVASAVVRRMPPSTVAVEVVERTPTLTIETPGASWKIDDEAVVIDGGRVKGAPVLVLDESRLPELGRAIDDPVVRAAVDVHTGLPAWLRDHVVAYESSDGFGLMLRLRVPASGLRAGGRGSEGAGERQRAGGRGSEGAGERQRAGGRGSEGAGKRVTVRVRFGDASDLALKVEVIRVLLPQVVADGGALDVRAPANPVVVPPL